MALGLFLSFCRSLRLLFLLLLSLPPVPDDSPSGIPMVFLKFHILQKIFA